MPPQLLAPHTYTPVSSSQQGRWRGFHFSLHLLFLQGEKRMCRSEFHVRQDWGHLVSLCGQVPELVSYNQTHFSTAWGCSLDFHGFQWQCSPPWPFSLAFSHFSFLKPLGSLCQVWCKNLELLKQIYIIAFQIFKERYKRQKGWGNNRQICLLTRKWKIKNEICHQINLV